MEGKVTIVGTGPGHPDFLTPLGAAKIRAASVLVGGRRLLQSFARPGQKQYIVDRELDGLPDFIKEHYRREKLVVLVSGDTGIYSLASYLARRLPPEIMEFIPGISSVQLMFARLKRSWHDASIISVHGRAPQGLEKIVGAGNTVAVLTDNRFTPQQVASYLLTEGCPDSKVAVGTNLSYNDENISLTTLENLAAEPDRSIPAVMVINYDQ